MVRKLVLSLIVVLGVCFAAIAQNRQVTGTVTSADGTPIAGATVLIDGTSTGTTTGMDGRFVLSAPADGVLSISFIGYKSQQVAIAGKSSVLISLEEDAQAIDDVVVLAFGETKKKDLTGSVGSVTSAELAKRTVSSVSRVLDGAVAGVQTLSATGQPGSDATIYIRGFGSINANSSALIVVDGVPYSSALSTLNPADIASINVSKDAAANALYGSRAANGVVFVTTKSGSRAKKANITFEAKWGWNQQAIPESPSMQNAADYYEFMYQALRNYGTDNYGPAMADAFAQQYLMPMLGNYCAYKLPDDVAGSARSVIDPATGKIYEGSKLLYHDNYDDYLFQKQFRQEYTVSVNGGNDNMDYYVSMGFLDDPSYTIMSGFKRYTGRAAINAQATKWLKVGANLGYTRRDVDNPPYSDANTGNVFLWTLWQAPIVPYYARDEFGQIRRNEDGSKMFDNGRGVTYSPFGPTQDQFNSFNNFAHPEQSMKNGINNTVADNIAGKAYAEVTFLKDFTFLANFSIDNVYQLATEMQSPLYGIGQLYEGFVGKSSSQYTSINAQQLLNWNHTFNGKHRVHVLLGHEFGRTDNRTMGASRTSMFNPSIPELSNAIKTYGSGSSSSRSRTAIEGYIAQADYVYDERFVVKGTYRRDGTSLFKYNKWGDFWSVSGAWHISNESFLSGADWMQELKLRASYGTSGNLAASSYPYTNLWGIANFGDNVALGLYSTGNPAVSWEKNKQVDVGVDFRFWDRFYGSIDYYNRRTHDLIWSRPTAASTGLTSQLENVGVLGNTGVEFDFNVDIFRRQDLFWTANLNLTYHTNKMVEIPDYLEDPYVSGSYLRGSGKPYYNLYLYKYAGVDPETGDELFWADDVDSGGNVVGRKTVGSLAEATRYEVGDALAHVQGGFSTSFRWKNLDASLALSFQLGGRQWDGGTANLMYPGRTGFAVSQDMVGNYWTPENTTAKYPKPYFNGATDFASSSCDALFRKASYLNLSSVNVGYTLPRRWTSKAGIESLRIFFSATNLAFVSAHEGFDPRTNLTSMSAFGFPQQSSYTFGVTLNL